MIAETCCSKTGIKINEKSCTNGINCCVTLFLEWYCCVFSLFCCTWQEREDANTLFKSKKGKELQKEIAKKSKTFVPGAGLPDSSKPSGRFCGTVCHSLHAVCVVRLQWPHAVCTRKGCRHLLEESGAQHFVTPCRPFGWPNPAAPDSCGDDKYWGRTEHFRVIQCSLGIKQHLFRTQQWKYIANKQETQAWIDKSKCVPQRMIQHL